MFGPPGGGGAGGPNMALIYGILGGYCAFLTVMLAVAILFLLMLMRTLQQVRPRNRAMEPGLVWLNLVPCLDIVWKFLTVVWVARSLDAEYRDRGLHQRGESYGKTLGMTGLIAQYAAAVIGQVVQVSAPSTACRSLH